MAKKPARPPGRYVEPRTALTLQREARELLRKMCPAVIYRLATIATDERQKVADQIAAGRIIVEYALSRPRDEGDGGQTSSVQALIAIMGQPDEDETLDVES